MNRLRAEKLLLADVDANHGKTWVHQRLSTPLDQSGAMTLFQTNPAEHLARAKLLTAERKTEEFVRGKGTSIAPIGEACRLRGRVRRPGTT